MVLYLNRISMVFAHSAMKDKTFPFGELNVNIDGYNLEVCSSILTSNSNLAFCGL